MPCILIHQTVLQLWFCNVSFNFVNAIPRSNNWDCFNFAYAIILKAHVTDDSWLQLLWARVGHTYAEYAIHCQCLFICSLLSANSKLYLVCSILIHYQPVFFYWHSQARIQECIANLRGRTSGLFTIHPSTLHILNRCEGWQLRLCMDIYGLCKQWYKIELHVHAYHTYVAVVYVEDRYTTQTVLKPSGWFYKRLAGFKMGWPNLIHYVHPGLL